jgi:hypothetical protein
MLTPHHAVEREFECVGITTEHRDNLTQFVITESERAM